jgi:hypothetical protein
MKKLLLFTVLSACTFACTERDSGVIGTERFFEVLPAGNDEWPGGSTYDAISYTYQVHAQGGTGNWRVEFETEQGAFSVTPDYNSNTFTVSVPANNTEETRKVTLKVTYNDDTWRYIDLEQIPNFVNISKGKVVPEGNVYRYTVKADATTDYTGNLFVPGGEAVTISYVGGDEGVVENTFEYTLVKSTTASGSWSLSFRATGIITEIGWREATYKIEIAGRSEFDTDIVVRQYGLDGPTGSMVDASVPGGYYFYRMRYNGVDVAISDVKSYNGKSLFVTGEPSNAVTWNEIFDPGKAIPQVFTTWDAALAYSMPEPTPNPCPAGWHVLTREDGFKIIGGTVGGQATGYTLNYTGIGGSRLWFLADGIEVANTQIFDMGVANYYHLISGTPGIHASAAQCCRITMTATAAPTFSSASRTQKLTLLVSDSNKTRYGIRCVRATPSE